MARLDHIAYRVASRNKTVDFLMKAFGYRFQAEFEIFFNEEKTDKALCIALEPSEKPVVPSLPQYEGSRFHIPWTHSSGAGAVLENDFTGAEYHIAPEIFISEGTPGSIVGQWVAKRDGVGGVHHLAYQVPSVEKQMQEWLEKGYAEFSTEKPMTCPGLTQVFNRCNLRIH
jgi:catechol 2,3-dioxygenase-like lactoylglutathione lyase family enzyme